MGTEHYIVDRVGKNVLDCHKWYALGLAVGPDGVIDRDTILGATQQVHKSLKCACVAVVVDDR